MDIGGMLSNPWVLGGGVVLGLVVLMSSGSKGEAAPNVGFPPSLVAQLNAKAMDVAQAQGHDANALAMVRAQGSYTLQARVLDTIARLSETSSTQRVQEATVRSGVYKTAIAANAAVMIDRAQNTTRLFQTYAAVNITKLQTQAQVKVAEQNAAAAESSMWGNIAGALIGTAGKVAMAAV